MKKHFLSQFISSFGNTLLQILYFAFMTRLLTKSDFGVIAIANVFNNIGLILLQGGITQNLVREKELSRKMISSVLSFNVIVSLMVAITMLAFRGILSTYFRIPQLVEIIPAMAAVVVLTGFASSPTALMQREFRFKRMMFIELSSSFIGFTLGVILGFKGYGYWSMVWALLVRQTLLSAQSFLSIKWNLVAPSYAEIRRIRSFGSQMFVIRFANFMLNSGYNIVLARFVSIEVLGLFERTYRIAQIPPKVLGDIVGKVSYPLISKIRENMEELRVYLGSLYALVFWITLVLTLFFYSISDVLVTILFGKGWEEAIPVLAILFALLPLKLLNMTSDTVIRAFGLLKSSMILKSTSLILILSFFIAFSVSNPLHIAFSFLIVFGLNCIGLFYIVFRITKVPKDLIQKAAMGLPYVFLYGAGLWTMKWIIGVTSFLNSPILFLIMASVYTLGFLFLIYSGRLYKSRRLKRVVGEILRNRKDV